MKNHVQSFCNSKDRYSDNYWTPLEFIRSLGEFDLDPFGNKSHPTAKTIYDINDDGFSKPWFGRVWMNPPYSRIDECMARLEEHNNGVALVFARTDTRWAQRSLSKASAVFFAKGRFNFMVEGVKQKGNASAPSMIVCFGPIPVFKTAGVLFVNENNKP